MNKAIKKILSNILLLSFLITLMLVQACTSVPPETEGQEAAAERRPQGAAIRPPPPDGLNTPGFRNIPEEARAYLGILSEAFRQKNRDFLISQGETQYERELRHQMEDETYLALLYRVGSHNEDSQWASMTIPRLNPAEVRAIEYAQWEEAGPMLRITGRLHLEDNNTLQC